VLLKEASLRVCSCVASFPLFPLLILFSSSTNIEKQAILSYFLFHAVLLEKNSGKKGNLGFFRLSAPLACVHSGLIKV